MGNLARASVIELISGAQVWMESEATRQLEQVAGWAGCERAVGLPDLHPGRGSPVGAAFQFRRVVHPSLIGSDAGCGAHLTVVRKASANRGNLARRADRHYGEPLAVEDRRRLFEAAWEEGPRGLLRLPGLPEGLLTLAAFAPEDHGERSGPPPLSLTGGDSLGTIGGGNHFAELSQVGRVGPHPLAAALGLEAERYVVLVHSGSRGLGAALYQEWGHRACEGAAIERYLQVLTGAVRWARTNRVILAYRGLLALGAARSDRIASDFDVVHNGVEAQGELYLHRKGAAPADAGLPTLLLGSRGAPSFVLAGRGRAESLCSSAHGAGRKMTRAEARAKLKAKYPRKSLVRTRLGSEVLVDDPELLYEEHPDAYKPIEPIVDSLVQSGVAEVVAELLPRVTVKR